MKPNWIIAIVVTALFMGSQLLWGRLLGVDYDHIFDSTESVWTGAVVRVGLTALIFTVIAIVLQRMWGGVYVQKMKRLPAWMWVIPGLMAASAIVRIVSNDWSARGLEYILVLALGMLFVGIAEETTFRGIVIRALRGSTKNEFVVMLVSSVLFGLLHAVNIFNGAEVGPTITQVLVASVAGIAFYVTVRLTGSIFLAIFLHSIVDFSILGQVGDGGSLSLIAVGLQILMYVVSAAAAIVILVLSIRDRKTAETATAES